MLLVMVWFLSFDTSSPTRGYKSCQKAECQTSCMTVSAPWPPCAVWQCCSESVTSSKNKLNWILLKIEHLSSWVSAWPHPLGEALKSHWPPYHRLVASSSPSTSLLSFQPLYFQQRITYPIMDGCVRIQTEGHCFASFWNPTFSSSLSTIFIASFSSVPSSPDANYWAMWPLM